jgi:hypothetical protein
VVPPIPSRPTAYEIQAGAELILTPVGDLFHGHVPDGAIYVGRAAHACADPCTGYPIARAMRWAFRRAPSGVKALWVGRG